MGLALGVGGAGLVAAAPAGATNAKAKTVTVSTAKVANVGTVLTTANGLTLYRFTEDPSGSSVCTGVCAKIWPPLFAAKGAHIKGPKGVKGLTLIKVGNHWQVAFHKVALYRYVGDKKKGQAKGQMEGNVWFAVLKSGVPAATATGAGATPSTSAPSSTTTNPPTPTTQRSSGSNSTPAPMPARAPVTTPPTTPPTSPPTSPPPTSPPTTPPTSPPTTTPTTVPSGGGVSF